MNTTIQNIQPRSVGAPSKLTEEVTQKLESIFKIGGTIAEACSYALISDSTYNTYCRTDGKFLARMDAARHYADIVAKNIVVDTMIKDKNIDTAKWWLEKREFKQTGNSQQTQVNVFSNLKEQYTKETEVKNEEKDILVSNPVEGQQMDAIKNS